MKKPLLIVFAAFCMHFTVSAQVNNAPVSAQKNDVGIKDIVSKLQTLSADRVIEKAYLHFDKPYYDPGDTIYFKAYVTAGERHELSKISGVLHVDLISKNDSIMQSVILKLTNGQTHGDFAIPQYLAKGVYRVRAYTQWMQNAGNKYVFDKNIPVTGRSIARVRAADNKTDVQFFAEGGSLVSGLPSKVSFKAVGADGLGISIRGSVIDNMDKEVTKFTTAHLGMGQIFITPEGGKSYRAKVTYPDGKVGLVDLPKPEAKGITLNVNNDAADKIAIEINANKPYYLENKNKEISVVIYNGGIVKTVKTVLDNQVLGFDLPKKDLRTGVVQVTLFSQNGVPLNERLAFIQNADVMSLNVNTDKPSYATRGKVHISMNTKTAEATSATGYFSVAVTNDSKIQADDNNERSILSDLLLTTDLAGYVEQPGYYFNNVTADTRKNLDILMLTQGYRRYVWKDLLNETTIANTYSPEPALQLKGTLVSATGEPVAGGKMTLLAKQSGLLLNAVTDANGKFVFNNISFLDRTNFLLRVENASSKNKTKIVLDKTYDSLPVAAGNTPPGYVNKAVEALPEYYAQYAKVDLSKTRVLNTVLVNSKANYRSSNLSGAGNADQVIYSKSFKNASTLSTGLEGVARGIKFENGKAYLKARVVGMETKAFLEPMLTVVDGVITSEEIDSFNPNDVMSVEILKSANASIYGMAGGAGVIIINTKQGGEVEETATKEMAPGLVSINPQGFYVAREFYSPNIAVSAVATSRGTVLWKPDVITDKDGNASFDFDNTALPGTYRMVIEGLDANGNLARSVVKYIVQ